MKRTFVLLLLIFVTVTTSADAAEFTSDFADTPDRAWAGPEYWTNPMEDWQVADGRLECITAAPGRNMHLLTRQLSSQAESFKVSVRIDQIADGAGIAGFDIGVHDDINDYRGNCFFGKGVEATIEADGTLNLAGKTFEPIAAVKRLSDVTLSLSAEPADDATYNLTLTATDSSGKTIARAEKSVPAESLLGNIALVSNPTGRRMKGGAKARFRFDRWTVSGDKLKNNHDGTFGPVLWSMYTLSDSRGDDGYVLKITAQMPPIGAADSQVVKLERHIDGDWQSLGTEKIDADARTATFRVTNWPKDKDIPYRLVYTMKKKSGASEDVAYEGTIRKEPLGRPLVFAGLTCQYHYGFPYAPVAKNLATLDPDMLFFSGDQIYEGNGGFGIIREPADRATLNYLRKWYMFGWAFGDVMRDRPTVCLPDDHDVFHGNLWGEAGTHATGGSSSTTTGYLQPIEMVQAVHRTHTAHNPDLFDPTPVKQGMSVYYGDMVYGRVSFGIVGDRQFKSSPQRVDTGGGRADHVRTADFDVSTLDKPGLEFLGERQEKFLDFWVGDWRAADMKMLLSETTWQNIATHHGGCNGYLRADLDSGGWPQTARNRALRIVRKGFPLHVNGDQHLTTLSQYGIDGQRDGCWSFNTPAIAVGYQRWWRPDELGQKAKNRPAHGLPNTGEYIDGFDHPTYIYAVGNPSGDKPKNRYELADAKASGFGIVRIDTQKRTYTVESYRFNVDLSKQTEDVQYPGFPLTIEQTDNYSPAIYGKLPEISIDGIKQPVLKVINRKSGELVYALRLKESSVRPWIFEDGSYDCLLGDPDTDTWKKFEDLKPTK